MGELGALLATLDDEGVKELIIRTGQRPFVVEQSGRSRGLGGGVVDPGGLRTLLKGTGLGPLIGQASARGLESHAEIDGRSVEVQVVRRGVEVQLRFRKRARPPRRVTMRSNVAEVRRFMQESRPTPPPQAAASPPAASKADGGGGDDALARIFGRAVPAATSKQAPESTPRPEPPRRTAPKPRTTGARRQEPQAPRKTAPPTVDLSHEQARERRTAPPAGFAATPAEPLPADQAGDPLPRIHGRALQLSTPPDPELVHWLQAARNAGASDLHLIAGRPVLARRAGQLFPSGDPLAGERIEGMLDSFLFAHHVQALEDRGYADLAADVEGAGRVRVNVSLQRGGLKAVFRLVPDRPQTLEELGLPAELDKATSHHQGLVIVSGPNGHGKSTTLAALVDRLNARKACHIITIEDPVEVVHEPKKALLTQREVGSHTLSVHSALKAALREDPDVIVIGELRDRESVELALTAAETGHLVLTTMSTPSAARTIDAMIDMVPPQEQGQVRAMLAGALKVVVGQRLLPTTDGKSLVAAAELLVGCVPLWSLIRDRKLHQLPGLMQRGRALGFLRFEDSVASLMDAGKVGRDTVRQLSRGRKRMNTKPPAPAAAETDDARGILGGLFRRRGK